MQLFNRIAFLILALIVLTNSAYAVTVPYSFTSGTPAMASQVNANFQALSVGMPGYLGSATLPSAPLVMITGAPILSFTTTTASSGVAIISGTGTIKDTTGRIAATTTVGIMVDGVIVEPSQTLSVGIGQSIPFNIVVVLPNLSAGTHIINLTAGGPYAVSGATLVGTIYH